MVLILRNYEFLRIFVMGRDPVEHAKRAKYKAPLHQTGGHDYRKLQTIYAHECKWKTSLLFHQPPNLPNQISIKIQVQSRIPKSTNHPGYKSSSISRLTYLGILKAPIRKHNSGHQQAIPNRNSFLYKHNTR